MRAQGVSVSERPRKRPRLDGVLEESVEKDAGSYAEEVQEETEWASTLEHAYVCPFRTSLHPATTPPKVSGPATNGRVHASA